MKKLLIFAVLLLVSVSAMSQRSPVDEVFDRYSGKEGFTTVYISSKMFSILSGMNSEDKDFQNLVSRIKTIRILTENDSIIKPTGFGADLLRRLPAAGYEDLMLVKNETGEVRFMILEVKGRIAELVMVSGGKGSSLVSIVGDLDLKTIASISEKTDIEELKDLEKVDQKPNK
jgi:hypothetical protein